MNFDISMDDTHIYEDFDNVKNEMIYENAIEVKEIISKELDNMNIDSNVNQSSLADEENIYMNT